MIFLTSDLHIGHDKQFMWGKRGCSSIDQHDDMLVQRWNQVVTQNDAVLILGDLMLGDQDHGLEVLRRLNGMKSFIAGNHDTEVKQQKYNDAGIINLAYAQTLKWGKWRFYLSHYPTLCAPRIDGTLPAPKQSMINLCGHSHTLDRWIDTDKGWIYHCELDAHQMRPVAITDIISDIQEYAQMYPTDVKV